MISNPELIRSVSNILQRSERQDNIDKLVDTYVDSGILPQLMNRNNQILYGRRGTGKTHIFKVLMKKISEDKRNASIYFDCRMFGSSSQFTDGSLPITIRCLSLFRDFTGVLYNELLNIITDQFDEETEAPFELLVQLSNALFVNKEKIKKESLVEISSNSEKNDDKISAEISANSVKLGGEIGSISEKNKKIESKYTVVNEDKIIFGEIYLLLNTILEKIGRNVFLLIDEWSSLPLDVQPYFAEFLKRSCLPCNKISIKIASLEYRSEFFKNYEGSFIGIEPGADIPIMLDIDDYYVYDRNPEHISALFADILYRHINSELPDGHMSSKLSISSPIDLPSKLFTASKVFNELVLASEGVVRDLINIFTNSYFDSLRRHRDNIDRQSVIESARSWFEKDKSEALDSELTKILEKIVGEVIGKKKTRSFMLPRELQKHPIIQRLFDLRVLHLVLRGYADKDNPGRRYNIYCLDYGTYVGFIHTKSMPDDYILDDDESLEDKIVPFDDKRSIRRIILTEDVLSTAQQ